MAILKGTKQKARAIENLMMNRKGSLYAVIGGCVGAVLTLAVCSVMPIGAQNGDATFGEIICTGLKVVDAKENVRIWLRAYEGEDGRIWVWGKGGSAVELRANEDGGAVFVEGRGWAAGLNTDEYGGRVWVNGKGSNKSRAALSVNEHSNGTVSTWDKNGDRLATLK